MPGDVSPLGVLASLVLVAVAIGLSLWQRLGVERSMLVAAVQSAVQLLAIGVGLLFVLRDDSPILWSWAWVVAMIVFATETTARRAPEVPGIRLVALMAYAISGLVTLGVIFGFGIFPIEGRTLVPLAGMMIGNSLTATVLVGRRIVAELTDKRDEVEARLALGLSSREAGRPYLRESVRTALLPQIERTRAVGVIFLPGAMTGLILAGVDPVDAVLVQIVVMYLVLGAAAATTVVVSLGLERRAFTPDHRLRRLKAM